MAAYGKKKRAAKKKKRAARKREAAPKKRAKSLPKKTAKRAAKKISRARKVVKKTRAHAKKPTTKKAAPKKRSSKKPAPRTRTKRAKVTKVAKKRRAIKKKSTAKKRPKKRATLAALKKANRELQKQIRAIRSAEAAARQYAESNPRKTQIRAEKKRLAKNKIEAVIRIEDGELPKEYRKRLRRREEAFKSRFLEMRGVLERAREAGEIPPRPATYRKRRIANDYNVGEQRYLTVDDFLFEEEIEPLLYRARRAVAAMSKRFKVWIATLTVSSFGEKVVGSGIRIFTDAKSPGDMLLQTQGFESTRRWNTPEGMLEALETLLYKLVAERRTVVFLHHVRIYTFTPRRHG